METLTSNIKRLVAIDKKYHEAPVFIAPKEDPKTRKVIDYKSRLPQPMQEKVTIDLEPVHDRDGNVKTESSIRVQHLQMFDLNNPNEALFFEVIRDDEMIANSKDEVNPLVHRYYIEDKEKEAVHTISKSKLKAQAFKVLAGLSTSEMENYAKILGKYMKDLSSNQIESALYGIADESPQKILDVSSDGDLKYKIFLTNCVERNLIRVENGKYMNGKDLIGINEDYAIQWLKDPRNNPIISQWGSVIQGGSEYVPPVDIAPAKAEPEAPVSNESIEEEEEEKASVTEESEETEEKSETETTTEE